MRIEKYTAFFHDGAIREIQNINNNLKLSMESAQVLPEWDKDNIALSKRDTISGNLLLEEVKTIKENDKIYVEKFKMKSSYVRAGIYDFEIKLNTVYLLIWWVNHPSKLLKETPWSKYEIKAGNISWENIPTLFDEYWNSLS